MSEDLNVLRIGLGKSFASGYPTIDQSPSAYPMTRAYKQVLHEHGGAGIAASQSTILSAISSFRQTREISGFRELKYICLGMSAIDPHGWCALAEPDLRATVAQLVSKQNEMRRRIQCFQAMLSSYWTFPLNSQTVSVEAREGWKEMRTWLRAELERIQKASGIIPQWFTTLARHAELLTHLPCNKFGEDLLRGDSAGLREAMEELSIPNTSWVLEEAIFSQMKAAAALPDEDFRPALDQLLVIATGRGGIEIGQPLQIRCVASLVSRYVRCRDHSEHPLLRDTAISTIGNPWLRRTVWDAHVVDGRGHADDHAREMINGWLNRRLITDFFEILSIDGTGDRRRLDYWLRFEPFIEPMWFALGSDALYHRDEHFQEFRSNAEGRLLNLDGSTPDNNAFVMRIGEYLAIEFGAKGHAFFLFKWDTLDRNLVSTLLSGRAHTSVSIPQLKKRRNEDRLIHRDSNMETWEQKFDNFLCPLFGQRPEQPPHKLSARSSRIQPVRPIAQSTALSKAVPTTTANNLKMDDLKKFAASWGIKIEDFREKGGALWLMTDDRSSAVSFALKMWDFRYKPGKGWWRE